MITERRFPIQGETDTKNRGRRPPGWVPWGVAELAYKVYVRRYGTDQSLEKLAERGGFGWTELINLLLDRDWCLSKDWLEIPVTEAER
jgi:hypothetical protein